MSGEFKTKKNVGTGVNSFVTHYREHTAPASNFALIVQLFVYSH